MSLRKVDLPLGWQERIKSLAWQKIFKSSLMAGCKDVDDRALEGLYCGFWHFVDTFPEIIQSTYRSAPDPDGNSGRFLRRASSILAGTLEGMEADERAHRTLWIKSARAFEIEEGKLHQWPVVPEIRAISNAMSEEMALQRRLMHFVATEIVAEGISRCLTASENFKGEAGAGGLGWFNVHLVDQDDETTHEAIAYNAAFLLMREAGISISEDEINREIQKSVDLFIEGARGCCTAAGYPVQ